MVQPPLYTAPPEAKAAIVNGKLAITRREPAITNKVPTSIHHSSFAWQTRGPPFAVG